jgi:hypothetical protein
MTNVEILREINSLPIEVQRYIEDFSLFYASVINLHLLLKPQKLI